MESFEQGLMLMVVGMLTVFAILLVVIGLGRLLISLVNKYAPEEVVAPKKREQVVAEVSKSVTAVITAAVNTVTGGKGKVVKIEKM